MSDVISNLPNADVPQPVFVVDIAGSQCVFDSIAEAVEEVRSNLSEMVDGEIAVKVEMMTPRQISELPEFEGY